MSDYTTRIFACEGNTIIVDIADCTVTMNTSIPGIGCWFIRFAVPEPDDLLPDTRELLAKGQLPVITDRFDLPVRDVERETHDNDALLRADTTLVSQEKKRTDVLHLPKVEAEALLHYFFRAPPLHNHTCAALLAGRLEAPLLYGVKDGYQDRHKLPNALCDVFGFATRPGWLLERFRAQY